MGHAQPSRRCVVSRRLLPSLDSELPELEIPSLWSRGGIWYRHTRRTRKQRFSFASTGFPGNEDAKNRGQTKIEDKLRLQTDFGETDAICVEVLKNPTTEEGTLLKVMTHGPFEQGQQVWILDWDGSKVGATVENVLEQTIDSEVTLSTVLPT